MSSRFMRIIAAVGVSFLLKAEQHLIVWVGRMLLICSSLSEQEVTCLILKAVLGGVLFYISVSVLMWRSSLSPRSTFVFKGEDTKPRRG